MSTNAAKIGKIAHFVNILDYIYLFVYNLFLLKNS